MTSKLKHAEYDLDKAGFKLFGSRLGGKKNSEKEQASPADAIKPLKEGTVIKSKNNIFQIMGHFGKKGYKVERVGSGKVQTFFMHVEPVELPVDAPQLKRYVFFLQNLKKQRKDNKRHFLKLEDRGRVIGQYNYLITTLADINLEDLRKNRLKTQFKPPSAMALSAQTLQAIHDVHLNHYIHRDIRPSNFLIGLSPYANVVYLIGFSLAYKYYPLRKTAAQKDPKAQTPRKLTKWRATQCKFQSRSYHLGRSIARIDDIESWFYMSIDFFGEILLPWNKLTTEKEIYLAKQRLFCDGCEILYEVIPKNFRALKNAISATSRLDPVDYTLFAEVLLSCRDDVPYDLYGPFEWEKEPSKSELKNEAPAQQENPEVDEKYNANVDEAITTKDEGSERHENEHE